MSFWSKVEKAITGRGDLPQNPRYTEQWRGTDLNTLQFDENGFPIGYSAPPPGDMALPVQYQAERNAAQRQRQYFSDAVGGFNQGLNLLQSYRPGGAAALASGMYQGRANLQYNVGSQVQAPDMLSAYREMNTQMASYNATKGQGFNRIVGLVTMGANAIAGNPSGVAAGANMATQPSPQSTMQTQSAADLNAGAVPRQASNAVVPMSAAPSVLNPQGGPVSPGGASGTSLGATLSSSPGAGGATGGFSGGVSSEGAGGGAGAGPSGGGQKRLGGGGPSGPGGAPGSLGGMATGGYGTDGNFTPTALSASNARKNPIIEDVATLHYSEALDPGFTDAIEFGVNAQLMKVLRQMNLQVA